MRNSINTLPIIKPIRDDGLHLTAYTNRKSKKNRHKVITTKQTYNFVHPFESVIVVTPSKNSIFIILFMNPTRSVWKFSKFS